jgi:hypothetical protein
VTIQQDDVFLALQNLYRQNSKRATEVAGNRSLVTPETAAALNGWIKEFGADEISLMSTTR